MRRIGILGVGELTEKIIIGIFNHNPMARIYLSPRNFVKAQSLASQYPCEIMPDNQAVVDKSDVVIIGVRPESVATLASEVTLQPEQTLVSLVAGMPISKIQTLFSHSQCIRAMLTYAAEHNSTTVVVAPRNDDVEALFAPLGELVSLQTEAEFELATVSMCMNGWYYFLANEMQQWLESNGLKPEHARALVVGNLRDCAAYATQNTPHSLKSLGESIATSGTYTDQGRIMLEQSGAFEAWKQASERILSQLKAQK